MAGKLAQQVFGRVERHHAALLQHRDTPTQGFGFLKVVGRQDDRVPFAVEATDELPEALAQFNVDAGSRLVEHDHRRLVHQRLRHQHTALHAARKTTHVGVSLVRQIEVGEDLIDPGIVVAKAEVAGLDTQGLAHREEGIEDQFLRHDAQQAPRFPILADDIAAEDGKPARIGPCQPGKAGNQGGLSGAIGTEQSEELTFGDVQGDTGECGQLAEALLELLNGNGNAHGVMASVSAGAAQASGRKSSTP